MTRGIFGVVKRLAVVAAMACATDARGFEVANIARNDSYVGFPSRRKVEVTGNYTLAAGEELRIVDFVSNSGSANGTFSARPNQWKTGEIDNGINTYRVQFHVWKGGRRTIYTTRLYTFGVK